MSNRTLAARSTRSRMLFDAGLFAAAMTVLAGCASLHARKAWHDEAVNLVQGEGDLVKIYHSQRCAAPMKEQDVFDAVASDSASWYLVRQAQDIRTERDSFIKKERMDSWYRDFRADAAKLPRTDLVAFVIGVKVSAYNFRAMRFSMCIEAQDSCDERELGSAAARYSREFTTGFGDLHHVTRNSGRYTLRVELPTNSAAFSQGAEEDRNLERFFVQARRRPIAFGIARIRSVEEDSFHDRHLINATLEAIVLKAGEYQPGQTPDYYWSNATKLDLRL